MPRRPRWLDPASLAQSRSGRRCLPTRWQTRQLVESESLSITSLSPRPLRHLLAFSRLEWSRRRAATGPVPSLRPSPQSLGGLADSADSDSPSLAQHLLRALGLLSSSRLANSTKLGEKSSHLDAEGESPSVRQTRILALCRFGASRCDRSQLCRSCDQPNDSLSRRIASSTSLPQQQQLLQLRVIREARAQRTQHGQARRPIDGA